MRCGVAWVHLGRQEWKNTRRREGLRLVKGESVRFSHWIQGRHQIVIYRELVATWDASWTKSRPASLGLLSRWHREKFLGRTRVDHAGDASKGRRDGHNQSGAHGRV